MFSYLCVWFTFTPAEIKLVIRQDVRFGYSSDREVLKGVSLRAEPGQSIAIVGPSGSGKSTLLRLLMRLYDVSSGHVLLNGIDVTELQQVRVSSAKECSQAFQKAFLGDTFYPHDSEQCSVFSCLWFLKSMVLYTCRFVLCTTS